MTFVTSRMFNQSASEIKKAAPLAPVIITDRGRPWPSHVLESFDKHQSSTQGTRSIVDMLAMQASDDADFDPPKTDSSHKPVDF